MAGHSSRGNAQIGTPNRGREASSRSAPGRVCADPVCTTILSTYNSAEFCGVHEPASFRPLPPTARR
jgi:hypothetical protein